jgi:hypothetical protein
MNKETKKSSSTHPLIWKLGIQSSPHNVTKCGCSHLAEDDVSTTLNMCRSTIFWLRFQVLIAKMIAFWGIMLFQGTLMMDAVCTSEMLVNFYKTARYNIPEDYYLHNFLVCPNILYHFTWTVVTMQTAATTFTQDTIKCML